MKILHIVESYYPALGGMPEVVQRLSELMVKSGHKVIVATSADKHRPVLNHNGVQIESFSISGKIAESITAAPEEILRYREFLLSADADVITFFAAQQWSFDLATQILHQISAKKIFVPTGFSGLFSPIYSEYFLQMSKWMKLFDMTVFLSYKYRDIDFAKTHGISRWKVITNGASEEEFLSTSPDIRKDLGISSDDFLLLLVGSHTGLKGHAEAIRIFAKSGIRNASLLIVGNKLNKKSSKPTSKILRRFIKKALGLFFKKFHSIEPCGEHCHDLAEKFNKSRKALRNNNKILIKELPRAKVVGAYKTADIFFFPSNIECSPIVLFEAMAAGIPFLSTDVGNSREICEWSSGGIILPTKLTSDGHSHARINGSAKILRSLWRDREKIREMGIAGQNAWKARFTWETISDEYIKTYQDLLNVEQTR